MENDSLPYVQRASGPEASEFTPTQLVEKMPEKLGKKLYAVIDLTFTPAGRYYNREVRFGYNIC